MTGPAQLLQKHRAGDPEAGRELCRLYFPVVRCLALAGTLEREAATGVIRAALERFYDRLEKIGGPHRLLPAAEQETREEVDRAIREQGSRHSHIVALTKEAAKRGAGLTVSLPELFADVRPDRTAWMLLEAASWIPDHHEAVFLLHYLEGMDPSEIAPLAGTPVERVRADLDAARRLYEREIGFYARKQAST